MVVRVRHKGQITLPAEVRDAAQLDEGAVLDVAIRSGEIVLRPVDSPQGNGNSGSSVLPDDLQARLERALEDVDAGRVTVYEDDESFFSSLK